MRPAGRLCTELHRHLTTAQEAEGAAAPDTEEDEEGDDENSESEEEDEEESSGSEAEAAAAAVPPAEPAKPQFSSEKELHSVVELITYMHTYCLPTRKQQGWERKDHDLHRPRARPEAPRPASTNSHSRVILVATPGTGGGSAGPRRLPFAKRREMKANSLLRELLQQSFSFDVSKPYRLHTPPYTRSHSPNPGGEALPPGPATSAPAHSPGCSKPKPELSKDRRPFSCEVTPEDSGSFSVRRSLRLASFPSRFAKRLRTGRERREEGGEREHGRTEFKLLPTQAGGGTTTGSQLTEADGSDGPASCCSNNGERHEGSRVEKHLDKG